MAPTDIQKLILFMLQRNSKVYALNIASVFVGSLEGFTTVMVMLFHDIQRKQYYILCK